MYEDTYMKSSDNHFVKGATMKSGKGHFVGAMQRLAKLRSGKLQHGVPKHAPLGGKAPAKSAVTGGPGLTVQATEGQTALNPKQRGASNKNAQTTGRFG